MIWWESWNVREVPENSNCSKEGLGLGEDSSLSLVIIPIFFFFLL